MRKLAALWLLMMLVSAAAQAQVAVPEIVPAAPRIFNPPRNFGLAVPGNLGIHLTQLAETSFVPPNPAAMQWGTPSRVGGGWIEGDSRDADLGRSNRYSGQFAGLRLVSQRVSFALGTTRFKASYPASGQPVTSFEERVDSLAFAFAALDDLAVGLSGTDASVDTSITSDDVSARTLGVSWRLTEHLFVGAATGTDYLRHSEPGVRGKAQRDYNMVGVGLRGGGALVWHLEYDAAARLRYRDDQGQSRAPGFQYQQGTVELGFWNLLFGYTAYQARSDGPFPADQTAGYTADFGFAPLLGITVTGRHEHIEYERDSVRLTTDDVDSVALTWQF